MELPAQYVNLVIGLSIFIGIVECFAGYRIFKFVLGLVGFLMGASVAGSGLFIDLTSIRKHGLN